MLKSAVEEKNAMFRLPLRIRKVLLPSLVIGIIISSTYFVFTQNFRNVFYDYQVTFHGLPGSYLATKTPNESYCNWRYSLPEELLYEETDLGYPPQQKQNSSYRVLENIIEAKWNSYDNVPAVTYVTHTTADFLNYLAEIIRFWEGPISIAAFVPDSDADLTIRQLYQLCSCAPDMKRVSVHLIFPLEQPPYLQTHQDKLICKLPDSSKLPTFRSTYKLPYPVNVCRNVARQLAPTQFVLVSDIQLVPSQNLASNFLQMTERIARAKQKNSPSATVYVVPVFEVDAHEVIPRTKAELVMLTKREKAVYFHRHVCSHCQKFPGLTTWLTKNSDIEIIKPFVSAKREYPYYRWEPVYIGSKKEPLYHEGLSWEGLQDKMTQMSEMCLIGYQFIVLDGAFLVHWPGIKRRPSQPEKLLKLYFRAPFQRKNSRIYQIETHKLKRKYAPNDKCQL